MQPSRISLLSLLTAIPASAQMTLHLVDVDARELDTEIGGVHWCTDVLIDVQEEDWWTVGAVFGGPVADNVYFYRILDPNTHYPILTAPGNETAAQRFATFVNLPREQFSGKRFGPHGAASIAGGYLGPVPSLRPEFADIAFLQFPPSPDGADVPDRGAIVRLTFDVTESAYADSFAYASYAGPMYDDDTLLTEVMIAAGTKMVPSPLVEIFVRHYAPTGGCSAPGCQTADTDADCDVDLIDLDALLSNFGALSGAGPQDGDTDSDGDVDIADLADLLARFGNVCDGPVHSLEISDFFVSAPEGGAVTLTVALREDPHGPLDVELTVTGDPDITIDEGGSLRFDSSNYAVPQTLTVRAAEDPDGNARQAVLRLRAPGVRPEAIAIIEIDDDRLILDPPGPINVPEGGEAAFTVRLPTAPLNAITVRAERNSGDRDIEIAAGETLVFDPNNFGIPQAVTLRALEDGDSSNGQARIRVFTSTYPSAWRTAREIDND